MKKCTKSENSSQLRCGMKTALNQDVIDPVDAQIFLCDTPVKFFSDTSFYFCCEAVSYP